MLLQGGGEREHEDGALLTGKDAEALLGSIERALRDVKQLVESPSGRPAVGTTSGHQHAAPALPATTSTRSLVGEDVPGRQFPFNAGTGCPVAAASTVGA